MNRIPAGWDAQKMHEEIYQWSTHQPDKLLDAHCLCWIITQDDRPLYVESCILWTHIEKADPNVRYRMWHLYRHPNHERVTTWRVSQITDSTVPASREFSNPPSSDEVFDFINDTRWLRILDGSFEMLDGAACVDNWKEVTGSPFPVERLHLLLGKNANEV